MRHNLYFLLISAAVHLVHSSIPVVTATDEMIKECQKETSYDNGLSAVKFIEASDISKAEKCFVACLGKRKGMLKEDGTMDKDKIKEVIMKKYPALKDKLFPVVDQCAEEAKTSSKDACDLPYRYLTCKKKKIEALVKNK